MVTSKPLSAMECIAFSKEAVGLSENLGTNKHILENK